jgi:hypothetical protein
LGEFHPNDLDPFLLFDARDSMIGTLENPTLDLDPSKPDTLNVITATRAGTATFTDVNGLIASAPANTVRVDQTQGAELTPTKFQRIGYTDFSQGWAAQSGVVAQGADDYQGNAVRRLTFDGVTTGGIYQTTINTIGGVSYTGSFYIRRISGSTPLYMRHGFSASGNQTAISVTTEWQQFSVTMLGASGGGNVYFGILQFGAGNDVYEITQPQFEEGTTASDFVENTTGSPKFITGPTFGPRVPMILVEPSAINQTKQSEDFNSSEWTHLSVGQGSTPIVTDNFDYSPDGTQNATRLQLALNGGNTVTDQSIIYDLDNSNTVQTISVWMKSNTNDSYNIYLANTYTNNGTDIAQVTPQWQRFSFSHTTSNHTFSIGLRGGIGSSDSADILIWGAQAEAGSVATSYIPTSGGDAAARTRAADNLEITGSAFSDFYNGSEGTFYVEVVDRQVTGSSHSYIVGQSASQFFLYKDSGSAQITSFDAGTGMNKSPLVANQLMRLALTYKSASPASRSLSLDGSTSDGSYNGNFSSANILKIGGGYSDVFSGYFRRILFWPYHSDNL